MYHSFDGAANVERQKAATGGVKRKLAADSEKEAPIPAVVAAAAAVGRPAKMMKLDYFYANLAGSVESSTQTFTDVKCQVK